MGRKRGRIYEELRRYKALYPDTSFIVVIDRSKKTRETLIPLSRVRRIGRDFMELDDGTMIPLHRVVRIERSVTVNNVDGEGEKEG